MRVAFYADRWLFEAALLGAVLIGVTLSEWGQPLICTCGYVQFWVGSIFSSGNSQHIADWYTLSHILHGVLIVLAGRLLAPRLGFRYLFAIAIFTGVAWELLEHTDWVLDRFRGTTLYLGYHGDSVLNAVADYLWMLGGFFLASRLSTPWIVAMVIVLEVIAAVIARDCLTLTTLMLIYPIEAIETWQQALNPNTLPAQ
jgi:hypothetical protein